MGKIAWEQNKKEKAVSYFIRIDQLFQKRNILNYELRHAYDYLIAYYKETAEPQKQLEVTEHLIALNHQFEKEQQDLTSTLHYELETKNWKPARQIYKNSFPVINIPMVSGLLEAVCYALLCAAMLIGRPNKKNSYGCALMN